MSITIFVISIHIATVIAGRWHLSSQFNKEVKKLFAGATTASGKTFSYSQLEGLPEPVQRYFLHVLKEGQPYISYARIRHDGQFKTGIEKDWMNITGEQYATMEKPGYIWKGVSPMFTARDTYIADKARLVVSIFSLYNIADAQGEHHDKNELLRWLGESVLYPTNLLPGRRLKWFAVDTNTAQLTFSYKKLLLYFLVTFNDLGEIVEMQTRRYMGDNKFETWIIKLANYKELNGVLVPTNFEVLWRLEKEDFPYAKFRLKEIEYDKPGRF